MQYLQMTAHSIQDSTAIIVQLGEKIPHNCTVRKRQTREKRVMHSSTPSEVRTRVSALANRLMIKSYSVTKLGQRLLTTHRRQQGDVLRNTDSINMPALVLIQQQKSPETEELL